MKFLLLVCFLCSCHLRQLPYEKNDYKALANPVESYSYKAVDTYDYEAEKLSSSKYGDIIEYTLKTQTNLVFDEERSLGLITYVNQDKNAPLLMIQPISKGRYKIEKFVARYFFSRGWNCLIVKRDDAYKKLHSPSMLNLQMHELILDNRFIIDFLYKKKPFMFSDIAMFGISKGGIKTSLIMGDEKRISSGVLVMAGGDFPNMLSESKEKGVKRARMAYLSKNGGGIDDFRLALKTQLKIDPLSMAPFVDGRKTLHFLAYFDKSVPYKYGDMLFKAMPGAQSYTLMAGHYTAILYLPFILNRAEAFYKQQLNIR